MITTEDNKHELVVCARCHAQFHCKANAFYKCQCQTVQLSIEELAYVAGLYQNCLCAACLQTLQEIYQQLHKHDTRGEI